MLMRHSNVYETKTKTYSLQEIIHLCSQLRCMFKQYIRFENIRMISYLYVEPNFNETHHQFHAVRRNYSSNIIAGNLLHLS